MSTYPRLVEVIDEMVPLAHVNLAFEACPAFDPPGREGLTCVTNRLLCRGTKRMDHPTLCAQIEALGTELLTSTQTSIVTLGGTVLARHLHTFVHLLGDIITEPAFEPEELERVRRELLAEHGLLLDNDTQLARYWLRRDMFGASRRGHAPIGRNSSVKAITMDDVKAWHKDNYVLERMVVGLSGSVAGTEQRKALSELVSRIPSGTSQAWGFEAEIRPTGRRILVIDKPDRTQSQILMAHPLGHISEADEFLLKLITSSFGGSFTSRLMQEIRVRRGLSYGAFAWINHERVCSQYLLSANCDAEKTTETLEVLIAEYERLWESGLTPEEASFARDSLRNGFPFTMETASQEAASRIRSALVGRKPGAPERYRAFLDQSEHMTDMIETIRRHLDPGNLSIVIVATAHAEFLKKLSTLTGIETVEVIPYDAHLED